MLSCSIIAFDQANATSTRILGKVLDVNGKGVVGVKVAVEGQKITATTSKDGSFKLEGVAPGNVYLYATAPSKAYLDGETLKSISVKGGANSLRCDDNPLGPSQRSCHLCRSEDMLRVSRRKLVQVTRRHPARSCSLALRDRGDKPHGLQEHVAGA